MPAPTAPLATDHSQSQETAKCEDIKGLSVKKLVLGEATDAETDDEAAVVREEVEAVGRAAELGEVAP